MAADLSDTLRSMTDLAEMVDADAAAPKKTWTIQEAGGLVLMDYLSSGFRISAIIVGLTLALIILRVFVAGTPENLVGAALKIVAIIFVEMIVLTPVIAFSMWFYAQISRRT